MSRPVFISYARANRRGEAEALHRALGEETAFLDSADIESGEQFPPRLVDALLGARVLVIFADEVYFQRWYCTWEYRAALAPLKALSLEATDAERHEAVTPLVLALAGASGPVLDQLPPELRSRKWPSPEDTAGLVKEVRRRLTDAAYPLAERIDRAGGSQAQVRREFLEESALPEPRTLAGARLYPVDLPPSLRKSFVGRAHELWTLHQHLRPPLPHSAPGTVVLDGLAGSGKTCLALEYVHRMGPRYYPGGIFRVRADVSEEQVELQLHGILRTLRPDVLPLPELRKAGLELREELGRALHEAARQPVLYVIENVPETPAKPLRAWCPALELVSVLATTRARHGVGMPGVRNMHLGTLGHEPAVNLLLDECPGSELPMEDWRRISRWVGNLPLALTLLNRALRHGGLSARELAQLALDPGPVRAIDQQVETIREFYGEEEVTGLGQTLRISYELLAPPARTAARLLAQLAPEPIPEALLPAFGEAMGAAVVTLTQRNFLTRANGSAGEFFTMHRVLADFLRGESPAPRQELLAAVQSLWQCAVQREPDVRAGLDPLLPHAEWLFERLEGDSGEDAVRGQARLGSWLQTHFHAFGAFVRMRENSQRVLERVTGTFGEDAHYADTARYHLGVALAALGRLPEAKALLARTVESRREGLGEEHPQTLVSKGALATVLYDSGQYREALPLQEEVLAAWRRTTGEDSFGTVGAKNNLAGTLAALGRHSSARRLKEEVLARNLKRLGEADMLTILARHNLAQSLRYEGKIVQAYEMEQAALETLRRELCEEHPFEVLLSNNLALLLLDLNRPDEGQVLQERAFQLCCHYYGKHHHLTVTTGLTLAETLRHRGSFVRARELQSGAVEALTQMHGPRSTKTLIAKSNMAATLLELGETAEAWQIVQEVMEHLDTIMAEALPGTEAGLQNLADVLNHFGRTEDVLRVRRSALEFCRQILGDKHPSVFVALLKLKFSLVEVQDFKGALVALEEAVALSEILTDAWDLPLSILKTELVLLLREDGQLTRAQALMNALYARLCRVDPQPTLESVDFKSSIVRMLLAERAFHQAHTLQGTVLAETVRLHGPEAPESLMTSAELATIQFSQGERVRALQDLRRVIGDLKRIAEPGAPQTRRAEDYLDLMLKVMAELGAKGLRRNEPCYCGSGKKFKHCHG